MADKNTKPESTVTIANTALPRNILTTLNTLRHSAQFCDVILEVHDTNDDIQDVVCSFHAHACVLAASSELLQGIIDPEPKHRCVVLKSMRKHILTLCLDYIYGCSLNINSEDLKELSIAAQVLQIHSLVVECKKAQDSFEANTLLLPSFVPEANSFDSVTFNTITNDEYLPSSDVLDDIQQNVTTRGSANVDSNIIMGAQDVDSNPKLETMSKAIDCDVDSKTSATTLSVGMSWLKRRRKSKYKTIKGTKSKEDSLADDSLAEDLIEEDSQNETYAPAPSNDESDNENAHEQASKRKKSNTIRRRQTTVRAASRSLCDHCGRTFASASSLKSHRARFLTDDKSNNKNEEKSSAESDIKVKQEGGDGTGVKVELKQEVNSSKEHLCPLCGDLIIGNIAIRKHKAKHKRKIYLQPIECKHCGQKFAGKYALHRHLKRVADNPNYKIPTHDKLQQKLNRHAHLKKKRPCKVCGEEFVGWGNYYRHWKLVHDPTFVCRYCGKVFVTPKYLKNHEQRHKKEKNFFCNICDFATVTKYEIDEHKMRHHLNEQYCCTFCPAVFKSKSYLQKHEREKHRRGLKQCEYCDYKGTELHLKRHVLNKHFPHQRKLWTCSVCSKEFTQKGHHDRHLLHIHHIKPTPLVPFSVNKGIEESLLREQGHNVPMERAPSPEPESHQYQVVSQVVKEEQLELEVVEEHPGSDDFMILDPASASMYALDVQMDEGAEMNIAAAPTYFFTTMTQK